MRIAIIASPWLPVPPPLYGGTERVLSELALGLQERGHEVLLFTVGESTCEVELSWTYERAQFDQIGNVVAETRHVIAAYDQIQDVDIVHDHTVVGPIYCSRFPDLTVVTTNHAPFQSDLAHLYRTVGKTVPILAISQHQASLAGEISVSGVIHHGINTDTVEPGDGTGGYLAYVGRMAPEKGAREAALIAKKAGIPLRLAAKMREPAEQVYFETAIKPLLSPAIEYVGELNEVDKRSLLGGATALLNPISWPEPFGLVMIEALAAGTPVVATNQGACPELIQHGVSGFIGEEPANLASYAEAAASLDRAACRRAAEARFSARRMARDHERFYEACLARRSR